MKILITGHEGFIGSNAFKYFSTEHDVITYEYSAEEMPVLDHTFDWVIHFGAISSTNETDVEKVMHQNFDFSCWLANECHKHNINLQYSSSASVYGLADSFKESDPVSPRTPYAWSKYLFERWVKKQDWNITIQGFRYFNVYGNGEGHKIGQSSPYHTFMQQAIATGKVTLFENSENYRRDFVPVERVIEVHDKFLRIEKSGVWNVGSGVAKSFKDVFDEVSEKYPCVAEYVPMPEHMKAGYQAYTCADLTLLNETLNEKNSG